MTSPRKLLLLAACVLGVSAPAAHADSIAYIQGGDVWLATPDGARTVPVTTTGGYTDVTQADDGTLVALHGVRLHRMDRTGRVLADFDTPVSTNGPTGTFTGPFNPALSPDGTKLSYTYLFNDSTSDPSCRPPVCRIAINEGGTGYSHGDRSTDWDEPGLGRHSGWLFASWLDDDTTVLSYPTHLPNADVIADTLSDGSSGNLVHDWFTDRSEGNPMVGAGDVTRDGRKLALQTGAANETISVYAVPAFPRAFRDGAADPSTIPAICYRYSGPTGGAYSQPTFAPSGAALAWAEADGVHVGAVPDFGAGCTTAGATAQAPLVIPGASEPDWGPADVPVPAPTATVTSARVGRSLKVAVRVPAAAQVSATAKAGGRVIARASSRRLAAGTHTLTLRTTRAFARRRTAKITVRVRVGTRTATTTATLRR